MHVAEKVVRVVPVLDPPNTDSMRREALLDVSGERIPPVDERTVRPGRRVLVAAQRHPVHRRRRLRSQRAAALARVERGEPDDLVVSHTGRALHPGERALGVRGGGTRGLEQLRVREDAVDASGRAHGSRLGVAREPPEDGRVAVSLSAQLLELAHPERRVRQGDRPSARRVVPYERDELIDVADGQPRRVDDEWTLHALREQQAREHRIRRAPGA